jgi:hypothetical protein
MEYQIIRSKDAYIPLKLFEAINRVLRQQINRSWRLCNETLRAALNNLTMSAAHPHTGLLLILKLILESYKKIRL